MCPNKLPYSTAAVKTIIGFLNYRGMLKTNLYGTQNKRKILKTFFGSETVRSGQNKRGGKYYK